MDSHRIDQHLGEQVRPFQGDEMASAGNLEKIRRWKELLVRLPVRRS